MTHLPEPWVGDRAVNECAACRLGFTLIRRRHHCRYCGLIFCGKCSASKAWVPGCKTQVRVCDACLEELSPAGFSRLLSETRESASVAGRPSGAAATMQASVPAVHLERFAAELGEAQAEWAERLWRSSEDGNGMCVNCAEPQPGWLDVKHGILICTACAGVHRGLGVQTSRVRSLLFDSLTEAERLAVLLGGNARFSAAVREGGAEGALVLATLDREARAFATAIGSIFESDAAKAYREELRARVVGDVAEGAASGGGGSDNIT